MEILKIFRVTVYVFILNNVLGQSQIFVGRFLIPPISEPQNFFQKTFKASQAQRDPNLSRIQHNYYHKHILKIPVDENVWRPIGNPQMQDKIDIRSSGLGVQERIILLGDGNHKFHDSANINQNHILQRPNPIKIQSLENNKMPNENVGLKSRYALTIPKMDSTKFRNDISDRKYGQNTSNALFVKSNQQVEENKSLLLVSEERLKTIEEKLADVLRKFEGNLSKILDTAVTDASSRGNIKNLNENIYAIERTARQHESGIEQMTEEIYSLPRPIQPNPSISGPPSFALIGRRARPLAETGYVSPPILKLNSNGHGNGTFDHGHSEQRPQEVDTVEKGVRGALRSIVVPEQSNFFANNTKSNINHLEEIGANSKIKLDSDEYTAKRLRHAEDIKILNYDRRPESVGIEDVSKRAVKNIFSKQFDLNDSTDADKLRANVPRRGVKSKRYLDIEEDDKKVSETIVRGNRVGQRASALHTSIDIKGLNTFNPGYNSADHLPPDPYVALFLSHYGRYLPTGSALTARYRNLYSYLASNNIHNNKPFGAYKIYEDADG